MKSRSILTAILLLLVVAPATAEEPAEDPLGLDVQNLEALIVGDANMVAYDRCGTIDFGPVENPRAPADLQDWELKHATEKVAVSIPVAVHVLHYDTHRGTTVGDVPDEQIEAQIDVLNAAYAGSGIAFTLLSIDRTESRFWCNAHPGSRAEREMKEALAVDPAHTFNLYLNAPGGLLLGWAVFPWSYPEDSFMHGVVIHYKALPGGEYTMYNEGDTATHEIGHYLGLYHTFQGGCNEPNDYCDDTPQEASPDYYCTIGRDSCPLDDGLDPIHNYMDYTPDECMYEFTSDQYARMDWALTTYRPSLLPSKVDGDAVRTATVGAGTVSAFPNPFNPLTKIAFNLRESGFVTVTVYDLAGRQVRTLLAEDRSAGDHELTFDGRGMPSGVYFAVVQSGTERASTRMMLIK